MSDTNPPTGCRTSLTAEVDTTALERDVEVASALANETRYELLRLLVAADGEVCACELCGGIDASQSTVSRGLSTLYEAGLASRRKEDQWRYYAPTEAAERLLETFDAIREDDNDERARSRRAAPRRPRTLRRDRRVRRRLL